MSFLGSASGPSKPTGPLAPWSPLVPCAPRSPGRPLGPAGPAGPRGPRELLVRFFVIASPSVSSPPSASARPQAHLRTHTSPSALKGLQDISRSQIDHHIDREQEIPRLK